MVNRIIRNSFGFMAWVVAIVTCVIINIMIALANYLGCRSAFELLNYGLQPLGLDGILGGFFQVFLSEATICNLFALSLNLSEIVGFFLLFHLTFDIYQLFYDRQGYLADEDEKRGMENAKAALHLIIRDAILLTILAVPMIYAIRWDIWLFRFRSVASALGIEDPELAAGTMKAWELQLQEKGELFALFMARVGGWGYVAVTALACMGVELSAKKAGESWTKLTSAIGEWYAGLSQQNENGSNAPNPNTAGGDDDNRNLVPPAIDPRDPPPDVVPGQDNRDIPGVDPLPEEELQPVMGNKSGERVTLAHAIGHPDRYWVDMETREIWDADFRKQLMESQ